MTFSVISIFLSSLNFSSSFILLKGNFGHNWGTKCFSLSIKVSESCTDLNISLLSFLLVFSLL